MQTAFTFNAVQKTRDSKREQIQFWFCGNLGKKFSSKFLHNHFDTTAFRARVSEINADANSPITIKNDTDLIDGKEVSCYWAERREPANTTPVQSTALAYETGRVR